jgi:ribosome recycling factor
MKNEPQATPVAHVFQTVREIEANAKARMEKVLSDLQHDMSAVRTGRASVSLLDSVRADYYGTPTPLNQLATLHVPEPSLITLQPWDVSQIGAIEKAIRAGDLGLNPSNDGKLSGARNWRKSCITSPRTIAWRCATSGATRTKT